MADITWDDVTTHASDLSSITDTDLQDDILEFVNTHVNPEVFDGEDGIWTRFARIYLAAHFGKMIPPGGGAAAGDIASMSEGGVSISFASAMTGENLEKTIYGAQFKSLVKTSMARFPIVM